MSEEKWLTYINTLQGHPSITRSNHTIESMKFITELIPPDKFTRVLNIGVAEGLETNILHNLGYRFIVGIIRGEPNLKFALQNYNDPNISFIECEMHDLPFPSEYFDAAYLNQTFEHSYAPFILLLELYCVLKVGGRVWIAMPNFKEITNPIIGDEEKMSHHHPNMLCPNLLKQLFYASGFKILKGNENNIIGDSKVDVASRYLLEKQPIEFLHSDVKTVIEKRKQVFG